MQAQKWIERARERRNAQQRIFISLMATRATRVAPEHVQALNMIDLEFGKTRWRQPSSSERVILTKWREYADHLNQRAGAGDTAAARAWISRSDDLFVELLEALGRALGYEFDRVQLRRGIYFPQAHSEAERRRDVFERALIRIVTGEASLPMKVTEIAVDEEAAALQKSVQEGLLRALGEDGALRVRQA